MTAWLRRQKFRVRLGALVAAAVGLTVALAAFASYQFVHHQLYRQVDASLTDEVSVLANGSGQVSLATARSVFGQYNNSQLQVIEPSGQRRYPFLATADPVPICRPTRTCRSTGVTWRSRPRVEADRTSATSP